MTLSSGRLLIAGYEFGVMVVKIEVQPILGECGRRAKPTTQIQLISRRTSFPIPTINLLTIDALESQLLSNNLKI